MNTATADKPSTAAPVERMPVRRPPSLVSKFAAKYSIDSEKLLPILKATAFKQKDGEVTNEQMAALLIVADQYGLNPFTREIFAFPDKQNGIVPVVSVDGWLRIINEDVMMNGVEFRYSEAMITPKDDRCPGLKVAAHEWIEAVFRRKDREHPIVVREYLEEVYRPPFEYSNGGKKEGPWQSHTKRMHRHKALIQGARVAFGFAGLFDEDEAHRIIEGQVLPTDPLPVTQQQRGAAGLAKALGVDTVDGGNGNDSAQGGDKPAGTLEQREALVTKMKACSDQEILDLVLDETRDLVWTDADRAVLDETYRARTKDLAEAKS